MCGIAGIVGAPSPTVLDAMLTALDHRGPDDRGVSVSDGAGLGMTRLAIIDLVTGRQPMTSDDGTADDRLQRRDLQLPRAARRPRGARRIASATQCDTEVILQAYEADGEACVDRLRRDVRVRDLGRRRGRCCSSRGTGSARSRSTTGRTAARLVFASEIKALLCHPGPGRAVDWPALHHYLTWGATPPRARPSPASPSSRPATPRPLPPAS